MPSHQDRRDPLPADYQFGDAGHVVLSELCVVRAKLTTAADVLLSIPAEFANLFRPAEPIQQAYCEGRFPPVPLETCHDDGPSADTPVILDEQ